VEVLDEFGDATGKAEFGGFFGTLVVERDFQTLIEKGVFAEACSERVVAKNGFFEDAGIRMKRDLGTSLAGLAGLLQLGGGLALFVGLLPDGAITLNFELKLIGESVDDGNADAVETAGDFVGVAVEFAARVKNGEDDFSRGTFFRGVHVNGNAAAVVDHSDGIVRVNGDINFISVASHSFVDVVVNDFPDQVREAHFAGRTDVHGRAQTNGFQAAENFDGFRVVLVSALNNRCLFITHLLS